MDYHENTQELLKYLSQNLPENIEGRLKVFDRLATKVFKRWHSVITYEKYVEYVSIEMSQGLFTIERSQQLLDTSENNPENFLLAFDLNARHAIAHRINAQILYDSNELEKSDSALQCATFHLGAVHTTKSASVIQKIRKIQKSKKGGKATSLNFTKSAEEFARLIRQDAPKNGWPSKTNVYYTLHDKMVEYEIKTLNMEHKDKNSDSKKPSIHARLKRWMETRENAITAYNENSSKSTRKTLTRT